MKLSQKKVCGNCKSLVLSRGSRNHCELNFKTKSEYQVTPYGRLEETIPMEPCYKPRTNNEWVEARNLVFKK